ncbi:PstS family phosphate ABC transporter substrate-binding protein [Candidatus Magnetaquicoccus inordinatus]|uniref:PstS family phosphate ABC transporter substrate-binding protein n=1 Tax=Candidatus Magnetaquicoccus inordinatus TaxID=2496818 RepID=UPI00102BDF27|nr:PstS family phosphate ABC transporter substrate-binding protein [Candidatus Magnetaquicoccus inordinatus]
MQGKRIALILFLCILIGHASSAQARLIIQNKGSDSLVNVAQAWAEAFQRLRPDVAIAVTGGGSSIGIASLLHNTIDIANSSREIQPRELAIAEKNGIQPVKHLLGYDALLIFVHPDNPLTSLTLPQLADMYGEGGKSKRWSDLGVSVPGCSNQRIILASRQSNSGTYFFFREQILGERRDFALGTKDLHSSKDVVELVAKNPCAIGYSGLAYAHPNIKILPIALQEGSPAITPSMSTAIDKSYPLSRPLLMYTPGEAKNFVKEYLQWIKSDQGQCILFNKGYAPYRPLHCPQ